MILSNTRFGDLEYSEEDIIYFSEGLIGFSQYHTYLLLPHSPTSIFYWLQSVECPSLAWPIVNPSSCVPDYGLGTINELDRNILIFTIVNIPAGKPLEGTINLLAPILINEEKAEGKQIIIDNTYYQLKHPLFSKDQMNIEITNAA